MKYIQSEKYNLAWFKLAECVSRREKERAMGVYRLLSHSLSDDALASQLKGDLLLCFNDEKAVEKYLEAANLYTKSQKMIEAIAIYEHLVFLEPDQDQHIVTLLNLYKKINMPFKIVYHIDRLIRDDKLDMALQAIDNSASVMKCEDLIHLRKSIICGLLAFDDIPEEKVMGQIKRAIDELLSVNDELLLQKFLSEIKNMNSNYYKKTCDYLSKNAK